jgi:hypothetical protein
MFNTCDGYPRNTNILEMTSFEFNEKYKDFLEEGHYGLAINIPEVVNYLDKKFQELIQVPGFKYSQIKLKFNVSRFYCEPREIDTYEVEKEIDRLVKNFDEAQKDLEANIFRFGG